MSDIIKTMGSIELSSVIQAINGVILQSQKRVLAAVNQEYLALFYGIERFVSVNTQGENLGKGFKTISEQLCKELPGLRGFSAMNLKNMRSFYEEWRIWEDSTSLVRTDELKCDVVICDDGLSSDNEICSLQRIKSHENLHRGISRFAFLNRVLVFFVCVELNNESFKFL